MPSPAPHPAPLRAALSRNAPCPCGSGRKAKSCCAPILDGAPAPTPEALMRSRYVAYAVGQVGHVMATTAPDSPHRRADEAAWRAELLAWSRATRFLGLDVRSSSADGDHGRVRFFARLQAEDGRDVSFGEHSTFVRVDGAWRYVADGGDP